MSTNNMYFHISSILFLEFSTLLLQIHDILFHFLFWFVSEIILVQEDHL